jgi:hypothetical protein
VTKPLVDEWRMASYLAAAHIDRPSLHRDESDGDPIRRSAHGLAAYKTHWYAVTRMRLRH